MSAASADGESFSIFEEDMDCSVEKLRRKQMNCVRIVIDQRAQSPRLVGDADLGENVQWTDG